jgi:hypothetical protein
MHRLLVPAAVLALLAPAYADKADAPGAPKGAEALFNGKDLKGWKVHGGKLSAWGAEKGLLVSKSGGGGWLMTEKEYGDFELRLEYRLRTKGANSGVALRSPMKGDPAYTGMEIQILDNAGHKGLKPWQYTGSIYGVVAPSKDATRPVGEWNRMRITAKGRKVTVEINGTTVVDANLDDHKEHFKAHPGLLRAKGHLGLQSHGGRIEFRNLTVKPL